MKTTSASSIRPPIRPTRFPGKYPNDKFPGISNIKLQLIRAMVAGSVCLGLLVSTASAQVTPLSTVNVNLSKGDLTIMKITGRDGRFTFDKLNPGKYQLSIIFGNGKQPDNIGSLETKRQSTTNDGVQVDDVSFTFGLGKESKPLAPVDIEITAKQGRVTGLISRDMGVGKSNAVSIDKSKAFSLRPEYIKLGIDARNQGRKGTCTVFGTVGVIEFHYAKRGNPVQLSEQFAAWAANKAAGEHRRGYFTEKEVIAGIKGFGICKEELMPYKQSRGGGVPNKGAMDDAKTRRSVSVTWIQDGESGRSKVGFSEQVISAIVGSIADGDPVTLAMNWPKTLRLSKDDVIGMQHEKGRPPGHIVVAVGYEKDAKWPGGGRIEIRNSWGPNWADEGYAWVTFEFLRESGSDAFAVKAF